MPFPPPPAARPPPRWSRKAAAPTCAPPALSPPAASAREKQRPPARPEALLPRSWPSATLRKPPGRRGPGPATPRAPGLAGSGASPAGTAASGPGRRPLSLSPEAALVLQRRRLEQPLLARPRRPLPAPSTDARRPPGPGSRAKAAGLRRGGDPGGLDARPPGAPLLPRGPRTPDPGPRRMLKVSLLNDRHKYDDVEYEEEAVPVDEGLVRRCTEWLRGVELAATARDRTRPLDALPHLSAL